MNLSKKRRAEIREMFGGKCAYCGVELGKGWHVDHVEPVFRFGDDKKMLHPENDRQDNLYPACLSCNIDKGRLPLEDWRHYLSERLIDLLRKYQPKFRHAERFERITVNPEPLVFWFEKWRAEHE